MEQPIKKRGRKKVFSEEDIIEKQKTKDARTIKFYAYPGFKDIFIQFVRNKGAKDISSALLTIIKNNDEFKEFKKSLESRP